MALLGVMILLSSLQIYSGWLQYELLDQVKHGQKFPMQTLFDNDIRHRGIGLIAVLGLLSTAIAFLMWTHRAYRNLPALGAKHLEHTPGWAVGWYFVPVANLVKPYAVTAEIFRYSNPNGIGIDARASSTPLVGAWWLAYIGSGLIATFGAFMLAGSAPRITVDALMSSTVTEIVSRVVSIVAAILAILVVNHIDQNQQARFDKISGSVPSAYKF